MSNNFALKEYFFVEFFLNESSWKALSEHLEIKNFENSPFLTLADTLTHPLRKDTSFPKCRKITQKFTQNRQTVVNEMSREIKRRLKGDRDIGKKAVFSDVKTAFTCTPTLAWHEPAI